MDIRTDQSVKVNKYFKIDLIQIVNTSHARGVVTLNTSLLHETIISIQEDGSGSEDKMSDLYSTWWYIDDIIIVLGYLRTINMSL